MPEEKKDSFTFSDKIKSSKPAASKSFANRISSKIGSNGKPKKTLFERTKRDAPFFIAALVALLLLPFLYKYSGQVNEEPITTPGSEESVFDPARDGFNTSTIDPDGQIAQYAGRDPLSMIKGFGSAEETPVYDSAIPPHDGMDSGDSGYTPPSGDSSMNSYKQSAPPATRAAFKRAATKIKELGGAGMTNRGGGQLAVGPWGGSLKKAASAVDGPAGPRSGPKPVSLQPLQAAGKPTRSYFGQGAAAEARRSKDALSKGNAMQALMDAQMRPVDPGKIGGLGGTDYRGGGNGDLKHSFGYTGIKPWWWDLLSQKHMHDWMWKRNLWQKPITMLVEELAKGLSSFLSGVMSCLITGTDDWSVGKLAGSGDGAGRESKCCGRDQSKIEATLRAKYPELANSSFKDLCKTHISMLSEGECKAGFQGGNQSAGNFGPLAIRANCLSNTWFAKGSKGKASFGLRDSSGCIDFMKNDVYKAELEANRDTSKWSIYHYAVGIYQKDVNKYYKTTSLADRNDLLVVYFMDDGAVFNPTVSKNYKDAVAKAGVVPMFVESIAFKKPLKTAKTTAEQPASDEDKIAEAQALMFASKKESTSKNAKGKNVKTASVQQEAGLPMNYNQFRRKFETGRNFLKDGASETSTKSLASAGREGKDWVAGARCDFPLARIECPYNAAVKVDGKTAPYATLIMSEGVPSNYDQVRGNISVWYSVQDKAGNFPITQPEVVKINHFNPKSYGKPTEAATEQNRRGAQYSDPSLSSVPSKDAKNAFDVYATQNVPTDGKTAVVIRWFVQQGEGVNDGKNNVGTIKQTEGEGDKAKELRRGLAVPGTPVSMAECTYNNDGMTDSVEPVTPEKPEKTGTTGGGNVSVGGGDDDTPDVGNTSFARELTQVPVVLTDRTVRTADAPAMFGSKSGVLVKACKEAPKDFGRFAIADDGAQAFVVKMADLYNKDPENKLPKDRAVIQYKLKNPSLANFVDAIQVAKTLSPKEQISKKAVCKFGQAVGLLSVDSSVKGNLCYNAQGTKIPCNNVFGAFATYIDDNSSYFPSRLLYSNNGEKECNSRFVGMTEKKGVDGLKCVKQTEAKYHYGRYNNKGDRKPFLSYMEGRKKNGAVYPLAELGADARAKFQRNPATGDYRVDAANRKGYWAAYGRMLLGDCEVAGTMDASAVLSYIQSVCANGLSDKPNHGWNGTSGADQADNFPAGHGAIPTLPEVVNDPNY